MDTIYTPEEIRILEEQFNKEAEAEFIEMVKDFLKKNPTKTFVEYNEEGKIEAVWF